MPDAHIFPVFLLPKLLSSQQTVLAELQINSQPIFHSQMQKGSSPGVTAADADTRDAGASQADGDVHVLEDDAESGEDGRYSCAAARLDGLAALECTGAARACASTAGGSRWSGGSRGRGRVVRGRGGDGKDCERDDGNGELGEHDDFELERLKG